MSQADDDKADLALNFLGELLEQAEKARGHLTRTLSPFKLNLRQILFLKKIEGEVKSVSELAAEFRLPGADLRDLCEWYCSAGYLEFVGMPYRGYRLTELGQRVFLVNVHMGTFITQSGYFHNSHVHVCVILQLKANIFFTPCG